MRSASSSENSLDAIRLCSASSAPFLSFFFATIDTSLESALLVDSVCLGPLPCLGMLVVFCLRLYCASPGRGLTPVRWLVGWLASQLGVLPRTGLPRCLLLGVSSESGLAELRAGLLFHLSSAKGYPGCFQVLELLQWLWGCFAVWFRRFGIG